MKIQIQKIIIGLIILVLFTSTVSSDYDDISDEDNFIMDNIKKHNLDGQLIFTKETYTKLLQDTIIDGVNQAGKVHSDDRIQILMNSIKDFVESKPDEVFEKQISYNNVYGDLTSNFVIFLQENKNKYQIPYEIMYGEQPDEQSQDFSYSGEQVFEDLIDL